MTTNRSTLVSGLLLVAALMAGCGSDTASTVTSGESAPSAPVTTSESTSESTSDADAGDPPASGSAAVDAPSGDPASGDPCGLATFIGDIDDALGDIMDPGVDVAGRKAAMTDFVAGLESWIPTMPEEISTDFESIVEAFRGLDRALAANDYDLAATMQTEEGQAALGAIGNDDPQAPFDRFNAWFLDTCGIDLDALGDADDDTDSSGSDADPLADLRLPFDPCDAPSMVDLTSIDALAEIDFTEDSGLGGTFSGDASKQSSCNWYTSDQSLLSIAAVAFAEGDADVAARDIRTSIVLFGGTVENLDDRYPAPAFATVFDTLVTVYVLGTDAPFGVSFSRTTPDSDPEPDLDTTYAAADALVDGLVAVPGGVAFADDELASSTTEPIDAEPFDSSSAVFGFDPCEAVTSAVVTDLVDTGGTTSSSGGGGGTYHSYQQCTATGATADGTTVDVTMLTIAFDDAAAAASDLTGFGTDEPDADLAGLPDGTFVSSNRFEGATVWVLDAETPFGVRVIVTGSDPEENDLALAIEIASAFLAQ